MAEIPEEPTAEMLQTMFDVLAGDCFPTEALLRELYAAIVAQAEGQ